MSLINDALKRARETQPKETSAAGVPLRPVEFARRNEGPGWLLPVLAGVILLLAALLLWQWFHGAMTSVRANTIPAASPVQAALPTTLVAPIAAVPAAVQPAVVPVAATMPIVAATNAAAIEPAKPKPITYKLQGIFYLAKNPSAVINGKTVYRGGHVDQAVVLAIGQETATIRTPEGKTNVLELPQ